MGVIEAHHVDSKGAGGGDEQVVPLCSAAHAEIHKIGRHTFRLKYGDINLEKIAAGLWKDDAYHRIKYEHAQQAQSEHSAAQT